MGDGCTPVWRSALSLYQGHSSTLVVIIERPASFICCSKQSKDLQRHVRLSVYPSQQSDIIALASTVCQGRLSVRHFHLALDNPVCDDNQPLTHSMKLDCALARITGVKE